MLWMTNLARTNPAAAAQRFTTNLDPYVQATVDYYNVDLNQAQNDIANTSAQPPLAWNDQLAGAAIGHSQDMSAKGYQSHTGSDGSSPQQRIQNAGYGNTTATGENAYAYAQSVDHAMEAFMLDWGVSDHGHRNNIMQPGATGGQVYGEVGIGIVNSNTPGMGPKVITMDFGTQANAQPKLLGVAYNDPSHQHQYTLGSGVGNVEVDATNVATGQTKSTQTWDNGGGYQIGLDPGTYNVTAKVNGQVVRSDQVTVGNQNIEVDYDLSDPGPGTAPAPQTLSVAPQSAAMMVASSNSNNSNSGSNAQVAVFAANVLSGNQNQNNSWFSHAWTARRGFWSN
jgi:uncharacterized protein YkwD